MKKKNLIFSAVGVGLLAAAAAGGFVQFQRQHTNRFLKVGIAVYDLDDPYIQTLTDAIRSQLKPPQPRRRSLRRQKNRLLAPQQPQRKFR